MRPTRATSSALLGLVLLLGAACASKPVPPPPGAAANQRRPIEALPSEIYADTITVGDFRRVCDALARDIIIQPFVTRAADPPVVTIRKLQNKSAVDLDEEIFQETIRVKLMEHSRGSVLFRDDASYRDIVEERLRSGGDEIQISITDTEVDTRNVDRGREREYTSGKLSGAGSSNERASARENQREVDMEQSGSVSGRVAEADYFLRGLIYQVQEPDAFNPKRGMSYFQYQFRVVDARSGIIVWEKLLDTKIAGRYTPAQPSAAPRGSGRGGAPPNVFQSGAGGSPAGVNCNVGPGQVLPAGCSGTPVQGGGQP